MSKANMLVYITVTTPLEMTIQDDMIGKANYEMTGGQLNLAATVIKFNELWSPKRIHASPLPT